jgi:hypothetical protein
MAMVLMRREMSLDELRKAIRQLGDPFRTLILTQGYGANRSEIEPKISLEVTLDYLLQLSAVETFEAIVLMLAWCEKVGDWASWTIICERYRAALPHLLFEGIPDHDFPLLDAIDDYARTVKFKSGRRFRSKQNWRTALRGSKKIRKEGAKALQENWESSPKQIIMRVDNIYGSNES